MKEYKATLETRTSQKGNEYQVLLVHLTDTYEKPVFLDKAELELLKIHNNDNSNSEQFPDIFN